MMGPPGRVVADLVLLAPVILGVQSDSMAKPRPTSFSAAVEDRWYWEVLPSKSVPETHGSGRCINRGDIPEWERIRWQV